MQEFDRDLAVELSVVSQVDVAHAARADLRANFIMSERVPQLSWHSTDLQEVSQ